MIEATLRGGKDMERMGRALHELCQPLTALQCGLELAGLKDTPEGYRTAVNVGLNECWRLADQVYDMWEIIRSTMARDAAPTKQAR